MKRRSPEGGYEKSGQKGHYRRQIWRRFHDHFGPDRHATHCLLMPSRESYEIEVALQNGFRVENLHVVDDNPAIIAQHKKHYPRIHTYGVDIVRACERIADEGYVIGAANFDLTSNISDSHLQLLSDLAIAWQAMFSARSVFALTLLRGRETSWTESMEPATRLYGANGAYGLTSSDLARLIYAFMAMTGGPARVAGRIANERGFAEFMMAMPRDLKTDVGIYRSTAGHQTMLWCVGHFTYHGIRRGVEESVMDKLCAPFVKSRFALTDRESHNLMQHTRNASDIGHAQIGGSFTMN